MILMCKSTVIFESIEAHPLIRQFSRRVTLACEHCILIGFAIECSNRRLVILNEATSIRDVLKKTIEIGDPLPLVPPRQPPPPCVAVVRDREAIDPGDEVHEHGPNDYEVHAHRDAEVACGYEHLRT